MNAQEIINIILERENLQAAAFAKRCNLVPTQIYDLQKGKIKKISSGVANKIVSEFPQYSLNWLLTGEDEMLRHNVKADEEAIEHNYEKPLQQQEDSIKTTKADKTYKPDPENKVPKRFITYLVPLSAMGESLAEFDEGGLNREDCEKMVSPIANIDWVVPVYGDSMEPEYPNGSKLYVRRINHNDFIAWGNVYVLDTTNGLFIKEVVESDKNDCVRCVSLNSSTRYKPFDVPMRAIRAMYRVMLCATVN